MAHNARAFIRFAIDTGVLRFGRFTLKSGRVSPYFFDAGLFHSGGALARLGRFYARAIADSGVTFDTLFGPAYKGIPLVTATAIGLADEHGRSAPWCFNRKEAKDHGEGGALVGAPLAGRVLIVDDVITAGTAIDESVTLIRGAGAEPAAVVIALDRQERSSDGISAVRAVAERHGLPVIRIATLEDILAHLRDDPEAGDSRQAIEHYYECYGERATE